MGIGIGFGVAIAGQYIVYPYFGMETTIGDNIRIAGIFTVISIIRSYFVRRGFNWYHNRQMEAENGKR